MNDLCWSTELEQTIFSTQSAKMRKRRKVCRRLRARVHRDTNLRFLTAGESHGPALTAILDGLPAGLPLTSEMIDGELARRQQGYGAGPRMKLEHDQARILGGVMEGVTTGAPLAFLIENLDHVKWRGRAVEPITTPRPGHADLAGAIAWL
jgi:chorismate synthase